ncbi:MAG TPA: hypothetical protein VJ885_06690 [Thermoanaerobaculia bacterium]|nr:hypothetical protein [Thermoanaerobaculia bacterium]
MVRLSCAILFLFAGAAKAQFLQFTAPGGPDGRPETAEQRLEREIEEAPYRLGPAYIAPVVGFRDAAYVRNLFASEEEATPSDVTVTFTAGLRAYLHTGRKVTWIAQAIPEYVWWNKREDDRRLNFSWGIGGVALFNRLTVDTAVSRAEHQRIVTPEIPELANTASDLARLDAELEATSTLFPFVTARWTRQEALVEEHDDPRIEGLELLDREERVARAGLRWRPRPGWMIGLGVERSEIDFDRVLLDSSNEGTSPVFEIQIDRRRFFLAADLAARSLKASEGSLFVDYDGVTGSVSVSVLPRYRVEVWTYANRDLVFSLSPDYPYLVDERIGLALVQRFGDRISTRVYGETGGNDYVAFSRATRDRRDDLVAFGGSAQFLLTNTLTLAIQATRIEFDSNLPENNRSYTAGGLTLSLRGNLAGRNL